MSLLDSIVCSTEISCEGELCCLVNRWMVNALCLPYKIYHRVDHLSNEYLNYFVAACNTRASATLGELTLVIPRCRTYQFCRSFMLSSGTLWNLLPSSEFSGDTLSCFKSTMKVYLRRV